MKKIVTGFLSALMLLGLLLSCQAESGGETEAVDAPTDTDTMTVVPQDTTQVAPEQTNLSLTADLERFARLATSKVILSEEYLYELCCPGSTSGMTQFQFYRIFT